MVSYIDVTTTRVSALIGWENEFPEFDMFDPDDSVGDIVCTAVGLDWAAIEEANDPDMEFECDVTLCRILEKQWVGGDRWRVTLQNVYSPELRVILMLSPECPYNIPISDFQVAPKPSCLQRGRASRNDALAKKEALYDYEIAALALHSMDSLNTRKRAYKRMVETK